MAENSPPRKPYSRNTARPITRESKETVWDVGVVLSCVGLDSEGYHMRWPSSEVGNVLMLVSIAAFIIHILLRRKTVPLFIRKYEPQIFLCIMVLVGFVAWIVFAPGATVPLITNRSPQPAEVARAPNQDRGGSGCLSGSLRDVYIANMGSALTLNGSDCNDFDGVHIFNGARGIILNDSNRNKFKDIEMDGIGEPVTSPPEPPPPTPAPPARLGKTTPRTSPAPASR
jgi:hypothetical protein